MGSIKRNAIIMAAGTSSRFVPLSYEIPKGLLEVKDERLIERQIRQLQEANINDITVVVGYKSDMFRYLRDKYDVSIVMNEDYYRYNNTSSVIRVLDRLKNTYLCSSDNYFPQNVFLENPSKSYYSALFAEGKTKEYCMDTDDEGNIISVSVGGVNSWYMIGHVYFSEDFSNKFSEILTKEYEKEETRQGYWEEVYIKFISLLPKMQIHKYRAGEIEEFDTIDELREFDSSYIKDSRSTILKQIADKLGCDESSLSHFEKISHEDKNLHFSFLKDNEMFCYNGTFQSIEKI